MIQMLTIAFFFASSLLAADVRLGPEVELSPPAPLRAAAYDQSSPSAASNGGDFLVAWADNRRLDSDVYVTRVGRDGRPANPTGRRIGPGNGTKVASAGGDYLIVWETDEGTKSLRLDEDGAPKSTPHDLGYVGASTLHSNGSTYLLTGFGAPVLLDLDGAPLRKASTTLHAVMAAGVRNGRYVVIDRPGPAVLHTIGDDGSVSNVELPTASWKGPLTAALGANDILLAFWSPAAFMRVGYDGTVIQPLTPLVEPNVDDYGQTIAAAWDGQQFLVVFSNHSAVRISPLGELLDAVPFPLTSQKMGLRSLTFSSNGATQLIAWSESRACTYDIVARTVPDFSALRGGDAAPMLLSFSGEAQTEVQMARGPKGNFAVWGDGDRWLKVSASFEGGPPLTLQSSPNGGDYIGWPAVASGQHGFLVVWRHAAISGPDRLLAKRFDFDGRVLDPEPLVLVSETPTNPRTLGTVPQAPSIVFDGTAFFVAWARGNAVHTIRVGEDGNLLDARATHVAEMEATSAQALWTGDELLVGYAVFSNCATQFCGAGSDFATLRLNRSGATISQLPPPRVFFGGFEASRIAATLGPDGATFAWVDRTNIVISQTTFAGQAKRLPIVAIPRTLDNGPTRVAIAWNGSEYVLVWSEPILHFWLFHGVMSGRANTLKARRFSANLQPIDTEPFEVSSGPGPLLAPFLIPSANGVTIVYSRADDENGGAPRAFMRTLDRITRPAHRRAVGR